MKFSNVRRERNIILPGQTKIPLDAHWYLEQELQRLAHLRTKQRVKHVSKFEQLQTKYRNEFRALIGDAKFDWYQKIHARRVKTMRLLRHQAIKNPKLLPQLEAKRRENRKKTQKLAAKEGVDLGMIRDLQKRYSKKFAALAKKIKAHKIPQKDWLKKLKRGELITLTPPFHGQDAETSGMGQILGEFEIFANLTLESDIEYSKDTGRIDHCTTINIEDASDCDWGIYESWVVFAKILFIENGCQDLMVLLNFENEGSKVDYSLYNECGWSSYNLNFRAHALIRLTPFWPRDTIPSQEDSTILFSPSSGNTSILDMETPLFNGVILPPSPYHFWSPGEDVLSHYVYFNGPLPYQSSYVLWCGIKVEHYVEANDYTVSSDLAYKLKLKKIYTLQM